MTNRTARNRPRADRAERKRVVRNRAERKRVARDWAERTRVVRDRAERTRVVRDRAERTRVVRDWAERTRVARDWAERKRVARNRAEHMRVVRDRAERTRSRYASVRAFVERLNAQPYELFKPRHRPPLSSRQFSLSTRVQPLPRQQHSFDTYFTVVLLAVFLDTRSIFVSPTLFSQYAPRFAFSIAVRLPLPHHPLSSLCWHSAVVSALLSFTRCRAVGWKGLFALCFAFSPDEWTRSGNESVAQEMDFVESRWK